MIHLTTRHVPLALAATTSLLLAACASNESRSLDAGERISARGTAISARGEAWTDGQHDVKKGQHLVDKSVESAADGEKRLRRAQEAVAAAQHQIQVAQADKLNGEQMMSRGAAQMQQAEADYTTIRNGPSAATPQ